MLAECPTSGLILPKQFIDEKQSLKKSIEHVVDKVVNQMSHLKDVYYISLHAKFDRFDPTVFNIDTPSITYKLPPYMSNQLVYWVNNARGICELLWMVPPKKKGEKLHVEFNKKGVAYLQAKGAMPS